MAEYVIGRVPMKVSMVRMLRNATDKVLNVRGFRCPLQKYSEISLRGKVRVIVMKYLLLL